MIGYTTNPTNELDQGFVLFHPTHLIHFWLLETPKVESRRYSKNGINYANSVSRYAVGDVTTNFGVTPSVDYTKWS